MTKKFIKFLVFVSMAYCLIQGYRLLVENDDDNYEWESADSTSGSSSSTKADPQMQALEFKNAPKKYTPSESEDSESESEY